MKLLSGVLQDSVPTSEKTLSSNRKIQQLIIQRMKCRVVWHTYEARLKSSGTGGSAPLLGRGRWWLLCRVVVGGGGGGGEELSCFHVKMFSQHMDDRLFRNKI